MNERHRNILCAIQMELEVSVHRCLNIVEQHPKSPRFTTHILSKSCNLKSGSIKSTTEFDIYQKPCVNASGTDRLERVKQRLLSYCRDQDIGFNGYDEVEKSLFTQLC